MARASVRQVAELAGVSAMTVSRIVRGRHGAVSPQKRELVLAAIRELDYVPVRAAFQNRHSETRIIGLVVDDTFKYKGIVAPRTLEGLRDAAFAADYDVLLMRARPVASIDDQKFQLLDRRCDGFIFVSPRERNEVLEKLVQQSIPTVSCYNEDVPEGIAWVIPDNVGMVQRAVQTLQQRGHRDIAYIAGPQHQSTAFHRRDSYIKMMKSIGLKPLWIEMRNPEDRKEVMNFVRQHATAAICHNDYLALHLWDHLSEAGVQVPHDISLIGVDDIPESSARGLTTFVSPYETIGQTAVKSLLELLQGSSVLDHRHTVPMTMVERTSVGPFQA